MSWFSFSKEMAMDLGTANTIIISNGKIVVDEPSVVALNRRTERMIAVGEKAKMMYEKTNPDIEAIRPLGDEAPEDYVVYGPNKITGLPMEVPVCYQEIAHCLEKTLAKIEAAVLAALEETPPELYADIVKNGIWLSGGGALLRGLGKRLSDKINIEFHVAEDPLHSVAKGTGIALKNIQNFSFLM